MKVAIVGYGKVGIAVFSELLHVQKVDELVLVGRNRARIAGEIADYQDSLALHPENRTAISGGGYDKTAGADLIIYTAGPSLANLSRTSTGDKPKDRLAILPQNLAVAREVSEELNRYNRTAPLIVISNPVDILVSAFIALTGRPREKVIGTGTLLDSARLSRRIAKLLDVDPANVTACVLGEHGNSSFVAQSWLHLLGMSADELISAEVGEQMELAQGRLNDVVRRAGSYIATDKGNTCYGVASAAVKIALALMHNTCEVLPVSTQLQGEYGIEGVALSVPCRLCEQGAVVIPYGRLTDEELSMLRASAEVIRTATGDAIDALVKK